MNLPVNPEVVALAEQQRPLLPSEFFTYYDELEASMASGALPDPLVNRGGRGSAWFSKYGPAILAELKLLMCTDDPKYAEVRTRGGEFGTAAAAAIGTYAAASLGLSIALTGAAAFIILAVAKVGVSAFCRMQNIPKE